MKYALGNMLNGAGGLNADQLALDLQFAADKTLTARKGPTPVFTRASSGTFVGSNGLIQSAGNNVARFDHDPVTLASRGLLIEESRTNLLQRSEELENAYWTKLRASVSTNATTSPAGDSTADKLVEDNSSGTHMAFRLLNTGSLVAHTFSLYAKADGRNFIYLSCGDGFPANATAFFNVSNGTIGTVGANATAAISPLSNGWYRCSITATPTSTSGNGFYIQTASANGTISYTGDGTSGVFIWGAQLEAGSFATSYIPTIAASVVRSADVCSITGAAFTGMYNNPAGTLISEAMIANLTGGNRGILQIDNDGNVHYLRTVYDFNFKSMVRANDTATTLINATGSASTTQKMGLSYEGTSFASCINGGAIASATRTMPVGLVAMRIGSLFSGFYLSGHISAIRYYKKRLANTKLQALTV